MFESLQEFLKAIQMGGQAATPATPAPMTPATPMPDPNAPASFANPNGQSAPGLTGQFPAAPGVGGMLAGVGQKLGTNDGTAGPTALGGLLNFKDEDSKQAAMRGLLNASGSLMAAGGPSDKPSNFLGNIGFAIADGQKGYDTYKDGQTDRAYKKAQTERFGVANMQDAYKLKQAEQDRQNRALLFGGPGFNGGSNTGATAASSPASGSPASAAPAGGSDLATQINRQRSTYQAQYNGLMRMGDGDNARPIFQQMNFLDNEAAKQGLVWDGTKYTAAPGYNEGAQSLKQAEATGTALGKRNEWTTDQQNYNGIKGSNDAAGLPTPSPNQWMTDQKKASSTQVNVNDGSKYGTIPQGYRLVEGPNGAYMEAIPGGPDAVKAAQAQEAKDKKADHAGVSSDAVETAFNNILRVDANSTLPTTGLLGSWLSNVGGTGSNDMRAASNTLKANASLSTLQKMRDESPTGAGMGNPTQSEQEMIQASLATLDQSQSREEYIRNLNNFRNLWMDLVHGQGNGPARHPVDYGLRPLTDEEMAAAEGKSSPAITGSTNNAEGLPTIKGLDDFYKLAPGTVYIDPQGNKRTKR